MFVVIYIALVFILDQVSKYLIISNMEPYESIPVIKNVFHLTYVNNTGAAFSMLKGKTLFFTVFTSVVILVLIYSMMKFPLDKRIRITFALIIGGGLGNLADRVRHGYVVDFIDFRVWPVFNIADCALVVGITILAIIIALHKDPESLLDPNRR